LQQPEPGAEPDYIIYQFAELPRAVDFLTERNEPQMNADERR